MSLTFHSPARFIRSILPDEEDADHEDGGYPVELAVNLEDITRCPVISELFEKAWLAFREPEASPVSPQVVNLEEARKALNISEEEFASELCLFSRSRFEELFESTFVSQADQSVQQQWSVYGDFCGTCVEWIESYVQIRNAASRKLVVSSTRNIKHRRDLALDIAKATRRVCSFFCSDRDYFDLLSDVKESPSGIARTWKMFLWVFAFASSRCKLASEEALHEYEDWEPAAKRHHRILCRFATLFREFVRRQERFGQRDLAHRDLLLMFRPFLAVADSAASFLEIRSRDLRESAAPAEWQEKGWREGLSLSMNRLGGLCNRVLDELFQRPCFAEVHKMPVKETLSVLAWKSGQSGAYVTHCLNYDLLTSADTLDKALDRLKQLFTAVRELKKRPNELGLPLAPYEFWERFERDKNQVVAKDGWPVSLDVRIEAP